MSVRLILDSASNLPEALRARTTMLPVRVRFGDEEYLEGINLTGEEFYRKLESESSLPATSQVPPVDFAKAFAETAAAGDTAVVLTVASALSGTYQSAMIAAAGYAGRIFVTDSATAAIGTGILAEYALRLIDKGLDARAVTEALEKEKHRVHVIALLDTLEYLKRGGRISPAAAFAGGILNIKPVAAIENGEVILLGKARGSKQSRNLLTEMIEKTGGVDFSMPVLLGRTGTDDSLLQNYIEDSTSLWAGHLDRLESTLIGSSIGTHAGPGAIAAAFFSRS